MQSRSRERWAGIVRLVDLMLAFVILVLAVPLVILSLFAISITSPGQPIHRQTRVGLGGRRFELLKLRTMTRHAEPDGPVLAAPRDHRLLPGAKTIRALHIDELPQLVNVLRGEMSLVGPRPERPVFVDSLSAQLPEYQARHRVRPGLTGLAQVTGGYHMTPPEKLECDLAWCDKPSLRRYLVVLARTPYAIIRDLAEVREADLGEAEADLMLPVSRPPTLEEPVVSPLG